ncbi:conserved hypothetical protein [Leishmania braziliensis MHOM/BR/75/M2904]|uniref:Uncharacterized protein n=2 Tax=Leishmania braziliensis TaxID=5660 RepID=A4HGC8_LEIBR|nr:conserved hypothetical protein [Leishmania braziliensis MHOM/BR/75/M2904]KAI5685727.1 hypothetical protein MNV84_05217 [Leishmania braziliensis]CAJ2475729.1 unnamed protein product [Leishmania braziliensis]CAJ2476226.1 unnamed protein product [Leishmania braziliensis]CAM39620.1 conserved hypothetical protein [Leishmania braziliensis MHOM/BR/75/M2904]SYZ67279.1 hypothetical_protein [Leishmania braziliensis MHOM/BR/75/M2904]
MNELEYFVASTHGSRCDIMRYIQQLRDLDAWIEYHLTHLRAIATERAAYRTAQARGKRSGHYGGRGSAPVTRGARGRGGRGRSRYRGVEQDSAAAAATLHEHYVHDVDASPQGDDDTNSSDTNTVAVACTVELQRQFAWHETCVQRHCLEREVLAAELAERCSEVRLSMASRLDNFASVAGVPVTELSR